ncbi:ABC-type transport auxiliary lipoprotein family protein [Xylella fastidiosa]|uniref:ABC transporter n=1 Tax=Xylella fastidiosa subsp. sandyi Ann-1 TaxID=155920 RepID=A0A060GYU8_XYLFS|nr:ABC-type transport auxiliary lipoprotein family protein [Xylella fastidiosa]AIC09649.1 ABC transporter [Xylella fastidiosa subsp. sandyi Ann-1]UIX81831.1 ABC-type transport auxiliary lipoprotein family protein [Xylella fastidiosa subsp. sandyi]
MKLIHPLVCLSVLTLASCSSTLLGEKKPTTIYSPQIHVTTDPSWPRVTWHLTILHPKAPRMIDTPRINVQPTPGEIQVYHNVSWAQPTTDMLEDALIRVFEDSGKIAGVTRAGTGIRTDYSLSLDLRRFESDYAGTPMPTATIEVNAKLISAHNKRLIASRTFIVTQPATNTDTSTVANAFGQALTQLTNELVGWTLTMGQSDAISNDKPSQH